MVGVAAAMLGIFSSLEVLAQPPRHVGKQLVQGHFCLKQRQFGHRLVRLQRQQVIFVECCQHDSPFLLTIIAFFSSYAKVVFYVASTCAAPCKY